MPYIQLTRGYSVAVDDEDYAALTEHSWYAQVIPLKTSTKVYAVRSVGKTRVYMHRVIMKAEKGQEVDHADGNGLNNCRTNLRLCDKSHNQINRSSVGPTGYRGVHHLDPVKYPGRVAKPFKSCIRKDRKLIHIGSFVSAEEAARAWDAKAFELFGEFAPLNFPE